MSLNNQCSAGGRTCSPYQVEISTKGGETLVHLNELYVGQRKIRYFYVPINTVIGNLKDNSETIPHKNKDYVFFLGGDILSSTSVLTKNMARVHLKYSKDHHCSKISFPHRLAGVAGHTKGAWFYDIHGLMKAAFDFYDFNEQIMIMKHLFTAWSSSDFIFLSPSLNLRLTDLIYKEIVPMVLVTSTDDCDLCQEMLRTQNQKVCKKKYCGDVSTQSDEVNDTCIVKKVVSTQTDPVDIEVLSSKPLENIRENIQSCLSDEEDTNTFQVHNRSYSLSTSGHTAIELLDSLATVLQQFSCQATSDIFFYKVFNLFEIFLSVVREELCHIEETTTGIYPFHLLIEYANLKKQFTDVMEQQKVPKELYYQDCVLKVHTKWLGTQFCKFHSIIDSQVEEFKHRHLKHNQLIPNSIDLITKESLYPSCMVEFLNLWSSNEEDNQMFLCSRILLVLELMNNTLITGMGHVVYAKLKSDYSM